MIEEYHWATELRQCDCSGSSSKWKSDDEDYDWNRAGRREYYEPEDYRYTSFSEYAGKRVEEEVEEDDGPGYRTAKPYHIPKCAVSTKFDLMLDSRN